MSNGRVLHAKAEKAREDGNFLDSLYVNDEALFVYDEENDDLGFAEAIGSRSITLRVYANLHSSKKLLTLAKYEMMAAVAIAQQSGKKDALALPLFNLAQVQEDLEEFGAAVGTYKEAISSMESNPPDRHNRPSILVNMHVHMEACAYKAGDKSSLERAEKALKDLQNAEEPEMYNKDVWVSGGYMRIAVAIKKDDPKKAKEYLQRAKEIIDANPYLVVRKQQWEKLSKSFLGVK